MKDNTISSTALTVMQGILYTATKDNVAHLVIPDLKEACIKVLASTPEGKKRLKQLESKLFLNAVPIVEKLMVPGLTLHYVLRKRYIEEFVTKALQRGFTQIVNLGAGFDTLAYRLSQEFTEVTFIEVDHPGTQMHKRAVFLQNPIENLHLLSVDFEKQSLEEELQHFSAFDKSKKTIFISEGVLMYLNEDNVKALFHSLKKLTTSDMEFIFTFIEPKSENPDSYGLLLDIYLKLKGEHLFWDIKKPELSNFVKSVNYELQTLADADYFQEHYVQDSSITLHRGEVIGVAK